MSDNDDRDNFSPATKEYLAKQSGYICAHPGCKRMTVADSQDRKSGLTMVGVAAHITAASDLGPRYDSDMSPEERSDASNGIWTCQMHGKFIDDNPSQCTVEELRRWKAQHVKWVFDRVESGRDLFNSGVTKLGFRSVGIFRDSVSIPIGRNNILAGLNESGKTTVCEILGAFTGGAHWTQFNNRFDFSKNSSKQAYIEISHQNEQGSHKIRLSPQVISTGKYKRNNAREFIHQEVNGCPSADWPRLFRVLYFGDQLSSYRSSSSRNLLVNALRYLAIELRTDENLIWDSLREELFANTIFGYRIRRIGHRKLEVLVPDGREFYVSHRGLSFTELQMTFLEIAVKFASCSSQQYQWIYIFDSSFFQRFDTERKSLIFKTLIDMESKNFQTIFCLHSIDDAEILKDIQSEKWVNAEHFGKLTLHSFL